MATDKPRVTGYIRRDIFELFDQFCKQYGVKHSKGVELVLNEYFSGRTPSDTPNPFSDAPGDRQNAGVTKEQLTEVLDQYVTSDALEKSSGANEDRITQLELTTRNLTKELKSLKKFSTTLELIPQA